MHESREDRDSTIDLAWATADLNARWEGSRSLEGSDHRAQVVSVGAVPPPASRRAGWSWAQMDREKVKAQATHLTVPRAEDITTDEQLEEAVDSLVSQLHQVADFSTPRAKLNTGQRAGWWDLSTKKAVEVTRKAGRRWRMERTRALAEEFAQAKKDQDKAIREAKRRCWRRLLAEASDDMKQLWRLERWARL